MFPHCENVLAIHKALSGHQGPNYWVNAELVMVGGRKMSRSLDNTLALSELRREGYSGNDIRFLLLGVHYRKPVNYSDEAIKMAKNTVKKINTFIDRLKGVERSGNHFAETDQLIYNLKHDFESALDDDLNIAGALSVLFSFIGRINSPLTNDLLNKSDADKILTALKRINDILGVMDLDDKVAVREINDLIRKREAARAARRWEEADSYREQLAQLGVDVLDTQHGVIWRFR
jgi:cysteinyl-tRNA synthetase